jgi:transposase
VETHHGQPWHGATARPNWRHTRRGDKYVTVIIDLTPIRDATGPSRLLDMVEGRSKQVFETWLAERPQAWRDLLEVVAMDGFTGFKTATTEELPDAVAVMDPFHVVRLGGDALDQCRRRGRHARSDADQEGRRHPGLLRPTRNLQRAGRSHLAASSTSAALPSASAT